MSDRLDDAKVSAGSVAPPAHIALLLPNLGGGGAEKVAVVLALAFATLGLRVEFILMRASGPLLDAIPKVQVFDLGVDRVRDVLPALVRYMRARRPRSMLVFMWPLNAAAIVARAVAGVEMRMVLTEHTDWRANALAHGALKRFRLGATMRLTYPRANRVVAVSKGAAESLARLSGMRRTEIDVVYNPITPLPPPGDLDPALCAGWLSGDGPRLIAIGRFQGQKDYPTLLETVRLVRRARPARLLVLGEGPLKDEMERLRDDLGLADAVVTPGFVSNPGAYLQRADLFVLSSAWEGFGNVIVEALACGTSVVSTDCKSGPREILQDGRFGVLAPVRDAPALAAAILSALDRPRDREALIARSKDFSIDDAARRYLGLLLPDEASRLGL